jgi:putative transposase
MLFSLRKINRLKGFNYSKAGYYFVTVCVKDRICCFGEIINGEMVVNKHGQTAKKFWEKISEHYKNSKLDEFMVMPNHIHGIIILVGADTIRPYAGLSKIIGYFKQKVSKIIRQNGLGKFSWQKSFYDHVIRDDADLNRIREYIRNNPKQWELDEENPKNIA